MPELPDTMRDRYIQTYELSFSDASQLVSEKDYADYFETVASITANPKLAANWVLGEFTRELNNSGRSASDSLVSAEDLAELIDTITSGAINNNQAKEVFADMFATGKSAPVVIAEKGFETIALLHARKIVDEIIERPEIVTLTERQQKLLGFFVASMTSRKVRRIKVVNELLGKKLRS